MSARIVIAGAGGFGRGVFGWLADSSRHRQAHNISEVAFIDDDPEPLVSPQAPIISTVDAYKPQANDRVICAIGVPSIRRKVVERLKVHGARFHTFVDDRAILGSRVQIAEGVIICPGVVVSADVVVAQHVHINFSCSVGHDTVLGAFSTLSPAVNIMGQVVVGEAAFFGGSAVVLPRLRIGESATIGAGTTVIESVTAGLTVVGNPARSPERKRQD